VGGSFYYLENACIEGALLVYEREVFKLVLNADNSNEHEL
jgi:hypothetical protein